MRGTSAKTEAQTEPHALRLLARLAWMSVIVAPVAIGVGACAGPAQVEVLDGGTLGDAGSAGTTTDATTITTNPGGTCGDGSITCGTGNGCCAAGYGCSSAGRCVSLTACTDDSACGSDSTCGGGKCAAWSNFPKDLNYSKACRTAVDLPSLRPEVKCSWPGDTAPTDFPTYTQVIGTPMVADFDFDNDKTTSHPSIVFISYDGDYKKVTGVLRVIDGSTCALQATIPGDFPFTPEVAPAIGDVDGDGRPEIVVADLQVDGFTTKSGVAVFSALGDGSTSFRELGRQTSSSTAIIKGISLHDLDNDNRAEILTDTGIYAYSAALRAVAEKVNVNKSSAFEPPIVHDIDGDGIPELITSTGIFTWDFTNNQLLTKTQGSLPVWNPNSDIQSAFVGVSNLGTFPTTLQGGGDSVEMVVIGFGGDLTVAQVDGRVIQHVTGISSAGGPPVIADFDGDNRMEFASPGFNAITVFDLDCMTDKGANPVAANCRGTPNANGILWQKTGLQGASSGASVFDFDGDHRAELVYADQCFMRIFDGITGDVLFSVPRSSLTRYEYPVIADTEGKGHSQIITGSNDYDVDGIGCPATDPLNTHETVAFKATHGVTVWADHDNKWAGSRAIWNQHSYSVTNINDDGSIPPMRKIPSQWNNGAQDPNSFRQNVQGVSGISLDLPDITTVGIPGYKCQQNKQAQVTVEICNRGMRTLAAGKSTLALVEARNPSNVLYTTTTTKDLASGTCEDVTTAVTVPTTDSSFDIMIMGDPNSAVPECDEGNNTSIISNVYCSTIQ
jgi:hypothetical protein